MPPDMNKAPPAGKDKARKDTPRHPYGPRPVGTLLPAITRPAFRKHSPAASALIAEWPSIVGPKLATVTQPRRLVSGTLTLGCIGPVALELQHLAGPLMERINTHLGRPLVQRLRFVQDASPASPPPPPQATARRLDPVPVAGVPPGELHDALAALGALVRAERA